MKCPYCDYIDTKYDFDKNERLEGGKGSFYTVSNDIYFFRIHYGLREQRFIFGCPNCSKVFGSFG